MIQTADNSIYGRFKRALPIAAAVLLGYQILCSMFSGIIGNDPYYRIGQVTGAALMISACVILAIDPDARKEARAVWSGYRSYEGIFVVGILVWFLLTCTLRQVLSGDPYFKWNERTIYITFVVSLIAFPLPFLWDISRSRKVIDRILHPAAVIYTVFSAWCVWNYYHKNYVVFPTGNALGMRSPVSMEMGINRNTTGAYACVMLAICLYLFFTVESALRYAYIPAILVQLCVSILANSRTTTFTTFFMVVVVIFMCVWNRLARKGTAVRASVSGLTALAGGGGFFLLRRAVFYTLDLAIHYSEDARSFERNMSSLSGRVRVWIGAVRTMFSSPGRFLLGVTPGKAADTMYQVGQFSKRMLHAHNVILQMGVAFGVPFMLLFIAFLLCLARRSLRLMFAENGTGVRNVWIVPLTLLAIVSTDMMEAFSALRYYYYITPVFYLFCGYVVALDKAGRREQSKADV